MIASPKSDNIWGTNQWVENAGHAVKTPEDIRDLYASMAAEWVDSDRTRHFAVVPASDREAVDAWFRLSFGQQHAYGIREVPATAWPASVREATAGDVDGLVEIGPLVEIQHKAAPVFARLPDETDDDLRAEVEREIATTETGSLVVEREGRIVGGVIVAPIEESSMHTGLARPDGQCILGWQATAPGRPRHGCGSCAGRRGARMGAPARLHNDGDRLARCQSALVPLLATARIPHELPRLYRSIP